MPPPFTSMRGLHIKALDLADAAIASGRCRTASGLCSERAQGDTTEGRSGWPCHQQSPPRRRIGAGQAGELSVETLKTEIDLEPLRVLDKKPASGRDVIVSQRLTKGGLAGGCKRFGHGPQVVWSHDPILISLPEKSACSSFRRTMTAAGGSRTTSASCCTACARWPSLAVVIPCSCNDTRRVCAASSVRKTPREIA